MALLKLFSRLQPQGDAPTSREFLDAQVRLEESVNGLIRMVQTLAPVGSCVSAKLTAAQIAAYFDSTGLGRAGDVWEGWAICNGANGTPNLDGKFTRFDTGGAGSTGGSDSNAHTHTTDIDHNHASFTSGSHVLTEAEIPAHHHDNAYSGANTVPYNNGAGANWGFYTGNNGGGSQAFTANTGGGDGHTHAVDVPALGATSVTSSSGGSATGNLPAYYEFAPVMRVA